MQTPYASEELDSFHFSPIEEEFWSKTIPFFDSLDFLVFMTVSCHKTAVLPLSLLFGFSVLPTTHYLVYSFCFLLISNHQTNRRMTRLFSIAPFHSIDRFCIVGGLLPDINDEDVRTRFSRMPGVHVDGVEIIRTKDGICKGFGYICDFLS